MASRRKSREARIDAKVERLRRLNLAAVSDGKVLEPGTPEYERELRTSALWLSEDELASMEAHSAKGS